MVTKDDFNKIWGSTSSVPTYTFADTDYLDGWEFVGNLPPTRAMWDTLQRKNDEKMQYLIKNGTNLIDNVATLRTTNAQIGEVYLTKGYFTNNDGGQGIYIIRADSSDTDDGGAIIILDNGNVAELLTDGIVNVRQFGAKGNANYLNTIDHKWYVDSGYTTLADDDADIIQHCITNYKNVVLGEGNFLITHYLDLQDVNVYGNGSAIKVAYYTDFTVKEGHKFIFYVYDNVNLYDVNIEGAYNDNAHRFPAATESGDTYDQGGITFFGENIKISGCLLKYIRESAFLVYGENVRNVLIENCKVTESGLGFYAETQSDETGINYAVVVRNCYFDANNNGCGIGNTLFDTCVFEQMRNSTYPNFNVTINDAEVEFPAICTFINCDFIADYNTNYNVQVYGFNTVSTHMHRQNAIFMGCRISGIAKQVGIYISANAEFHGCVFKQDIVLVKRAKSTQNPGSRLLLENCEMMRWGTGSEAQYLINPHVDNDATLNITLINCFTHDVDDNYLRLINCSSNMILAMVNCVSGTNNTSALVHPALFFGNRTGGGGSPQNSGYATIAQYRWVTDVNVNTNGLDASLLTDATFKGNALGVYDFSDGHVYFVGHNRVVQLD